MDKTVEVRQLYKDKDRGRLLRVLFVGTTEGHGLRKPTAALYSAGKLTTIAVERLLDPSRYEFVPEENTFPKLPVAPASNGAAGVGGL